MSINSISCYQSSTNLEFTDNHSFFITYSSSQEVRAAALPSKPRPVSPTSVMADPDPDYQPPPPELQPGPGPSQQGTKRKKGSIVHDYYEQIIVHNEVDNTDIKGSRCRYCPKVVNSRIPTNLKDHLMRAHNDIYKEVVGELKYRLYLLRVKASS